MPNQFPLTATLLACLVILPCSGQETGSAKRIRAKRMEIPRYLPLAQQAGRSGEVTLYLTVSTAGKVVAVDIVNAQPSGWGRGFASMAIDAAKQSEFECTSCSGDAFEHIVTYQFRFSSYSEKRLHSKSADSCLQRGFRLSRDSQAKALALCYALTGVIGPLKCLAQGQMSVVGMFRQLTLPVPVQAKVVTSYRHAEVYFL